MSKIITCNGCNKCCALGATPVKNNYVLDIEKQYYIPTINGNIITACGAGAALEFGFEIVKYIQSIV